MLQEEVSTNGNTMQTGEQTPIEVDTAYVWEAVYREGEETLPEYDRDPETMAVRQHVFAEIDLARCTALVLHSLVPECRDISVIVEHEEGMRPIFFRRYQTEFNFETGESRRLAPIHVLGWQRTIEGKNVSHYTYIFPDGSLLLSDRHDAV